MGHGTNTARRVLGHIDGGRVLDVATGRGGFIEFLADGLASYDEIVGIDVDGSSREGFEAATAERRGVRFEVMDLAAPTEGPASFDTVAICASLHHFEDPVVALAGMRRLARPGGWIVVSEMYRDGQTEAQETHVLLHDWWAAVDTLGGTVHRPTYRRAEIVRFVDGLSLRDLRLYDLAEADEDPRDPGAVAQLEAIIDRYVVRADGHPDLQARGEELRQRVRDVGVQSATSLVEVGRVARQ